jgi:hypothetical protein
MEELFDLVDGLERSPHEADEEANRDDEVDPPVRSDQRDSNHDG